MGADDYLCKPFHEQELLARINAFLRIKSLQDELKSKNQELEKLLKKVEVMAMTDAGTGLLNRRHFMELLDKEFARCKRFDTPLACLMLDIDHFKEVNDTYGHLIGDAVLLEIGQAIKGRLRQIDMAARYGGEEFVILLPETPPAEAVKPADRLLRSIEDRRFNGMDAGQSITASVGISGLPDPMINAPQDLIRCADYALYKAKHGGRNRIEVATTSECPSPNAPLSR
jgi:diguanylate cyclase (GGDEF)-like protein